MFRRAVFPFFLILAACGGGGPDALTETMSPLEARLLANTAWPYEVVGVLDIVEAGFEDSEYADWAVGSLVTDETDEFGVQINIGRGVAAHGKINIDSGERVKVWLEAPIPEYGVQTYPVSRIEKL